MLYDYERGLAIVCVPRSGAHSFGRALGVVPFGIDSDPHEFDTGTYPDYERIIILRRPLDRFLSCTRWLWDHPELWPEGSSVLEKRGFEDFARWACDQDKLPVLYELQTAWVVSSEAGGHRITYVPTHKMAEWFNYHQCGCLCRRNVSSSSPRVPSLRYLPDTARGAIVSRYRKDFDYTDRVAVWPSTTKKRIAMGSGR